LGQAGFVTVFVRAIAALAVILLPVWLTLGQFGLTVGLPLVILGLVIAAPGLAWLHMLERTSLRSHLLLGAAVGGLLAALFVGTMPDSDAPPGAPVPFNWMGGAVAACIAAPFGAWSGSVWWTFFAGRGVLKRLFSDQRLPKPHPNDW
jgi:hypothetical protein